MAENLDDIEKFENELNEEERKKLKEFLKMNLEIILTGVESYETKNGYKDDWKNNCSVLYSNIKAIRTVDFKQSTIPYLAFKHSFFENNHSLEKAMYPAFYLYSNKEKTNKKYILLAYGFWYKDEKFPQIFWDDNILRISNTFEDFFYKKDYEINNNFKYFRIYKTYLIEDNLEKQIDTIAFDLERILKYYIFYIDMYKKYKEKINNDKEIENKDLKEILEYYMKCSPEEKECEKDKENYNKIFFNFINEGFNFPLNTILYGNSEIAKNYVIYSVGIIERNKIISKEKSKENIDIDTYKEITSFNDYKNILEKFETYKENGQIEFISSNSQNTSDNFKNICEKAKNDKDNNNYILIIEDINKMDKLDIFDSKLKERNYNKEYSEIPKNLYILGIINTLSDYKAFLNLEFFNNFNFEKMYSKDQIIEKIGKIDEEIIENEDNFKFPLNTILYGPPGTGKTYNSIFYSVGIIKKDKSIIDMIKDKTKNIGNIVKEEIFNNFNYLKEQGQIEFVTFHQSYSYEDFVEGIRPTLDNKNISKNIESIEENKKDLKYTLYSGIFKNICERAESNLDKNYVLIIDEINRGNISKIFGELITLLEPSKRLGETEELKIRLPYSGEEFGVPKNLYILGTMNTADRSIALLDIALRRRFNFIEMPPKYNLLKTINCKEGEINLQDLLKAINTRIEFLLDKDHLIGHSYFINIKTFEDLKEVFKNSIMPLLQEYFYDDFEKIKFVLNIKDDEDDKDDKDNNSIIRKEKIESEYIPKTLPKNFPKSLKNKTIYEINEKTFEEGKNYINIYTLKTKDKEEASKNAEFHDN